jgi:hypothetical protein
MLQTCGNSCTFLNYFLDIQRLLGILILLLSQDVYSTRHVNKILNTYKCTILYTDRKGDRKFRNYTIVIWVQLHILRKSKFIISLNPNHNMYIMIFAMHPLFYQCRNVRVF